MLNETNQITAKWTNIEHKVIDDVMRKDQMVQHLEENKSQRITTG